jgi:hypothetical protein
MSTVIARRVVSSPVRTAAQTWAKIVEIAAPDPQSVARKELAKAEGVACASISSEATKDAAIVIWGGGPRVRVYCVFDDDAITQDDVNEDMLPKSPTEGGWKMSIPCLPDDVKWCSTNLAAASSRISARSMDDEVEDGDDRAEAAKVAPMMGINMQEFMKS